MLHTRALYNLARLNAQDEANCDSELWCIEDLRSAPSEELWSRLRERGISLDKEIFTRYAEECDTPEELSELLLGETEDSKLQDQLYLLFFELWRRFFPEKQSISIFCDELDYRIHLCDKGKVESDEAMQDALANLQEILDENADAGADPIDVFEGISEYCAHNLESFLCDVIATLLDAGNVLYASELLDGFSPYIKESSFEPLQEKLLAFTDADEERELFFRASENSHRLEPDVVTRS